MSRLMMVRELGNVGFEVAFVLQDRKRLPVRFFAGITSPFAGPTA
jgi:hypothetical protein